MVIEQMAVYSKRVVIPVLRQRIVSPDGERRVEAEFVVIDHLSIGERRRVSVGERVIDVHRTR